VRVVRCALCVWFKIAHPPSQHSTLHPQAGEDTARLGEFDLHYI
jgi:hypothetical protein